MLKNNFKLAFRNLIKNKYHSLINILGLSFGIACSTIIYLYVQHELSFNKFHEKKENLHKLIYSFETITWGVNKSSLNDYEVSQQIAKTIPSIDKLTAYRAAWGWLRNDEKRFQEQIAMVDQPFFEMFSFSFLAGDEATALKELNNIVITETVAKKFFGDTIQSYDEVLGRLIELPQREPNKFKITGVTKDIPTYSTLQFDVAINYNNSKYYPHSNNVFGNSGVYILLNKEASVSEITKVLNGNVKNYYGKLIESMIQMGYMEDKQGVFQFELQPLHEIYFNSEDTSSYQISGDKNSVYILSLIAFLILVIACVNYIMLTIGNSMNRMKEIGVLKILGARRKQIMRNFIAESFILILLSVFFGLVIAEQLLPEFNRMAHKSLEFNIYEKAENYIFLIMVMFSIVVVASTYMSIFLLKHKQPLQILKLKNLFGNKYTFARSFVILQYFITISLLISTTIIIKQIKFMQQKDVGFNDEDLIVLETPFSERKQNQLKLKLKEYPEILNASLSDRNFIWGSSSYPTNNKLGEKVNLRMVRIDAEYIETLQIDLIEGRSFDDNLASDSLGIIVNETLVKTLDIKEPIGHIIKLEVPDDEPSLKVIGVMKDYHYDAMNKEIEPLFLYNKFPWNSNTAMFVKIDNSKKKEALDKVREAWNEIVPEFDFEYSYLDENLRNQYQKEEKWSKITGYATIIAIFLSCLGLIGLTSLMVSKKTKEIGIRKVNGAGTSQILIMLNKTYLKWVLIAYIIASPVVYYAASKWLQGFAYKTTISWWIFGIAGVASILIAISTVSYQCWVAARKNPVDSLKYE